MIKFPEDWWLAQSLAEMTETQWHKILDKLTDDQKLSLGKATSETRAETAEYREDEATHE
jgi:hypothetical protein